MTQVTGILYTIPSIAAFFLLCRSPAAATTAEIALVAYVLLIIFRNVLDGPRNVPDETKDAGRGMGLTDRQLLWRVEVPLALPEIMAGLRIAATTTVGLATLAFFAGAGGLGEQIFADINFKSNVVVAGGLAVLLAALLDGLILLAQRAVTPLDTRRWPRDDTTSPSSASSATPSTSSSTSALGPAAPTSAGSARSGSRTWEHLKLSLAAMAAACALSIPLGLWLGHIGKGGFLAINASNVGRAVPSLALIAFFVAYLGVGFTNLTLALVLLAIPPILTNAYTGVSRSTATPSTPHAGWA